MSARRKGTQAFPCVYVAPNGDETQYLGMTLRDYFAAAALQGLLAHGQSNGQPEAHAQYAFAIADAMILERAK